MKLSLREAAKLCGRGKSTIAAAIGDGRLAADKNDRGSYEIDPAELHRVFPLKVDSQTGDFIEQRTLRDSQGKGEPDCPSLSLDMPLAASRTGRAGGALAQAEIDLRETRAEIERVKLEAEKDARHAAELAEKEIQHLKEALESEREAKADLRQAHEEHLRDLRRELEIARAMLPAPDAAPARKGFWARVTGR